MTGYTTEPTRTGPPRPRVGQNESWEHEGAARRRVRGLLQDLPPGFVVFDSLELPRPTIAVVDHLVIGPRNVWAVTIHVSTDPITFGRGRNADTLWAGDTSLRTVLEAADWESAALGNHIGFPVEPVICIVAPELPEPAFDFFGIKISEPAALVRQVATSTADFVDVGTVAAAVRRSFGVEPSAGTETPTLGSAVQPPTLRPINPRRRRTMGARLYAVTSTRAARVGALMALGAVIIVMLPTIIDVWRSVATEGADRVTAVIDDDALAVDSPDPASADPPSPSDPARSPSAVGYALTCPDPGGGWVIEWSWPGPVEPGVVGYSVSTLSPGSAPVVHTSTVWTGPTSAPPAVPLSDPASTQIVTHHRAADGSIVATASEMVAVPVATC